MHIQINRRVVAVTAGICALVGAPAALAAGDGNPFTLGKRNPTSGSVTKESQVIANIAQRQGGIGKNTGGFSTRQSNLSNSGGGAIYGCRSTSGTEACIASNNLANGDAFRFQAGLKSPEAGIIRFGTDINQLVAQPPFATNGTGIVKNLNAERLAGRLATDFVTTSAANATFVSKQDAANTYQTKSGAASDFAPSNILPYAVVGANGAISHGNFNIGNANVATTGGNTVFTISFAREITACAPTATVADTSFTPIAASVIDTQDVRVTQQGATAHPFNVSLACGGE